jgi:hypothetical protein
MQWNFTFDGNGNNTNLLEQSWEKSAWVNSQWLQYNWQQVTAVKQANNPTPIDFVLHQNYPNPFNPSTTINYSVPKSGLVTIKVYDIIGFEVARLVNEEKAPGTYSVNFNASKFASGVYLYRMQAGSIIETKKMILLK